MTPPLSKRRFVSLLESGGGIGEVFLCLGRYEFVAACGYRACFVGGKRSDITLYTSAGVMGKVFVFGEV